MQRILLLLFGLIMSHFAWGQPMLPTELHPASTNPAMIMENGLWHAQLSGGQIYRGSGLFSLNGSLGIVKRKSQFKFHFQREGSRLFGRNRSVLQYGLALSEWSSMGISLGLEWQPGDEGKIHTLPHLGFGFLTEIGEKWCLSIHARQVIPSSKTEYRAPLTPVEIKGGLAYSPKEELQLHLAFSFHQFLGLSALTALSYQLNRQWLIRLHYSGTDQSFGLQLGWKKSKIDLRLQITYGLRLGQSSFISLSKWP
jgi:hypothetical protein